MKKSVITLSALSIVFALGLGLVAVKNSTQPVNSVSAEPHTANFDPYTYSGSYYDDIDATKLSEGLSGTLRTTLTSLIYPEGWYTYGGSGSNTLSTQLQYADEDPTNSSNMIYLYTRNSVKKNAASSWNREHVWCQSLSNNYHYQITAGEPEKLVLIFCTSDQHITPQIAQEIIINMVIPITAQPSITKACFMVT